MNYIRQLPLQTVVKNLADSVALQFHLLSKKCVHGIKSKLQNLQNQRLKRRESLLSKYKARIQEKQRQEEQAPKTPVVHLQNNVQQIELEESRLARINRIKQAKFNNNFQAKPDCQNQKEADQLAYGINLEIVFQHFSSQLRPQILAKYPSAQAEKVNKVITQKWNNFEQAKKEAYIKKIKKKLQLQQKKKKQDLERKPLNEQQINQQKNNQGEVKRQETLEQQKAKKIINPSGSPVLKQIQSERLQKIQEVELGKEGKQIKTSRQSEMNQSPDTVRGVKQKYEPNSGMQ